MVSIQSIFNQSSRIWVFLAISLSFLRSISREFEFNQTLMKIWNVKQKFKMIYDDFMIKIWCSHLNSIKFKSTKKNLRRGLVVLTVDWIEQKQKGVWLKVVHVWVQACCCCTLAVEWEWCVPRRNHMNLLNHISSTWYFKYRVNLNFEIYNFWWKIFQVNNLS